MRPAHPQAMGVAVGAEERVAGRRITFGAAERRPVGVGVACFRCPLNQALTRPDLEAGMAAVLHPVNV